MGQKTFYRKVVLQQVFEITIRSRLASLTAALHGIPYALEDSILMSAKDVRAMRSSTEEMVISYSLMNQSHVTFCSLLQRSSDVEHAYSGSFPGTTIEWRARYNPYLHALSACRSVPRLNTSSSNYFGKRIAKHDFQQDRCS
ncbi:hypothetical protein TNCV_1876951 [Trichonephila clavipes]|nr:hypothetical protein TNCV_1876951 [Trichonephila clavipes]